MINLFEGLQEGDLNNLVFPSLSIDEYDSKLDDTAIVVGFYVNFKDPAKDLNRFIQKCPEDIIDTDISPAPDSDGNYMVFLELSRDKEFPSKIIGITNSLKTLTGIKEWTFRPYGKTKTYPLTEDNIKKYVDLKIPKEDTVDQEDLEEFLVTCIADEILFEDTTITFKNATRELRVGVVDFDDYNIVQENNQLSEAAVLLNESSQLVVSEFLSYFGQGWLVECLDDGLIYITHDYTNKSLLVVKE